MMLVSYCKRKVFGKFNKTQGCNSQSKRPITEVQLWLRLGTNRQAPAASRAPGGSAPVCPLHIRLGAFTSSVPLFFARIHPPLPCGGHLARRSRCPATPRGQILACRSRPVTDDGGLLELTPQGSKFDRSLKYFVGKSHRKLRVAKLPKQIQAKIHAKKDHPFVRNIHLPGVHTVTNRLRFS